MQIFAQGKVKKKLTYGNKEKVQEQFFFANSCYVWLTLIILGHKTHAKFCERYQFYCKTDKEHHNMNTHIAYSNGPSQIFENKEREKKKDKKKIKMKQIRNVFRHFSNYGWLNRI